MNKVVYKEDSLFDDKVVSLISRVHNFKLLYYRRHKRINHTEIDVYSVWSTPSGKRRTIILELKQTDFTKLVGQALNRREYGDYIYIVYEGFMGDVFLVGHFLSYNLCLALAYNIGVIYYPKSYGLPPILIGQAQYIKRNTLHNYTELFNNENKRV